MKSVYFTRTAANLQFHEGQYYNLTENRQSYFSSARTHFAQLNETPGPISGMPCENKRRDRESIHDIPSMKHPLFTKSPLTFPTLMSYNIFRHICRKEDSMNKRGQETRTRIKTCACSLFAEKGFKQVTMKDICEASGLSRGGLYNHYESTHQIFREILKDMQNNQARVFDQKIRQNQPATSILDDILEVYREKMLDGRSSLSLAFYEFFSVHPACGKENSLLEQYLLSVNTWKNLIQYGIDRQEFREVNTDAIIDLLLFSYQGVRMYSKLMPVDK